MKRDSIANTFIVATGLCLVCAAAVSIAAVGLRPLQEANRLNDKKKNILIAAGLYERGVDVGKVFDGRIIDRIIDLETGEDVTDEYPDGASSFDQDLASENKDLRINLSPDEDLAQLKYREQRSHVYIVKTSEDNDTPLMYVFPVRGKGLWSILKGFIALDSDLQTVRGLTYYDHAETPGLGGEVDNPNWKAWWPGKQLFDDSGEVAIVLKKNASRESPYEVDALSGATVTTRGVDNMLKYWMGDEGFGPFLDRIKTQPSVSDRSDRGATNG